MTRIEAEVLAAKYNHEGYEVEAVQSPLDRSGTLWELSAAGYPDRDRRLLALTERELRDFILRGKVAWTPQLEKPAC